MQMPAWYPAKISRASHAIWRGLIPVIPTLKGEIAGEAFFMGDKMARKLICGMGLNDFDEPVYRRENGKNAWLCPYYSAWKSMISRCYSDYYHGRQPTYEGCSASQNWLYFSQFRLWMHQQDWQGKQLDKDILFPGNKVYSAGTCIFVSCALNNFIIDSGRTRGDWPIGVCWSKPVGKFQARCRNPFTGEAGHIGYFDDPNDAHEAWRTRKHQHALRYADMQEDPRIAQALRTRFLQKGSDHEQRI
jgi:hypothetical protein